MINNKTAKSSKLQVFFNIFSWFLSAFFSLVAIFNIVILSQSIFSKSRPKIFGSYYLISTNNDMKGDVDKGDIIFLKDVKEKPLSVGNIIEVNIEGVTKLTKVVSLENGDVYTKQNSADEIYVLGPADVISGVLTNKITFIGKLSLFTQSTFGIILFLVLPIVTLIISLILEIVHRCKHSKSKSQEFVEKTIKSTETNNKKDTNSIYRSDAIVRGMKENNNTQKKLLNINESESSDSQADIHKTSRS